MLRRPLWISVCLCIALALPVTGRAAKLILNEYNAVGPTKYLNDGNATTDADGGAAADPAFGRVLGNGGDWFELVVIADHLDIRGWKLDLCDNGVCNEQLVFSQSSLWSDLRAGTILTVAEDQPTDTSYNPAGGDWTINVQANDAGPTTYISANSFPVSNDNWQLTIRTTTDSLVFGPAGEGLASNPAQGCDPPTVGVNSAEIFKLEADPSAIIERCSHSYNDGKTSTFGAPNAWNGGANVQSFSALRLGLPLPDRDTDGVPDDGNHSGVVGDLPCASGASAGCDDNCPGEPNANQLDTGRVGPGGADGIGNACQCGDVNNDGGVTDPDRLRLRQKLAFVIPEVDAPRKCGVLRAGECGLADASELARAIAGQQPPAKQVCPAAFPPTDSSALWFDPNRLLQVEITMAKSDWDVMRVQKRDLLAVFLTTTCGDAPFPDPYTFFHAPTVVVDGQTLTDVGIRKKGFFGSLSDTKPSLKLDFGEFVSGQHLEGLERMTLNNSLQDPSYVKQCLGYGILAAAGIPAPRCNFAHVRVHVTDASGTTTAVDSLYVNVESIKEPFLGRVFGDATGQTYEGTLSDFWLKGTPATGEPWRNTIESKDDILPANQVEVNALTTALTTPTSASYTDAQRRAAIEAVVDLDAYLTFWAGEGLIGHWDGYADDQNNFFFYVLGGKIRFIPWGIDDTFGRGNPLSGRVDPTADPNHCDAIVPRAALPRRLYEMADTRALYLAKLQLLLNTVWNPTAHLAEIDRMQALIQPVSGDLTSALAPIRAWVTAQRAHVQDELDHPPTAPSPNALTPPFTTQPDHFCFFD
jgi:hypothetical protein